MACTPRSTLGVSPSLVNGMLPCPVRMRRNARQKAGGGKAAPAGGAGSAAADAYLAAHQRYQELLDGLGIHPPWHDNLIRVTSAATLQTQPRNP